MIIDLVDSNLESTAFIGIFMTVYGFFGIAVLATRLFPVIMLKLISYEVSQARGSCYVGDRGMVWSYGAWAGCKASLSLVASTQYRRDTVIVVRMLVLLKLL